MNRLADIAEAFLQIHMSKTLDAAEEEDLYRMAEDLCTRYRHGFITPMILREFGELGDTNSAKVMCSRLIKKWVSEGKLVAAEKAHTYSFAKVEAIEASQLLEHVRALIGVETEGGT